MCGLEREVTPVYIQVGDKRTKVHAIDLCDEDYKPVAELIAHAHLKQHRLGDVVKVEPPALPKTRRK